MAGDRAHFPRELEVKTLLASLANAMGAVAGFIETMADDELAALADRLERMTKIVDRERARRGS